jgi:hypothetical protein
MKEAKVRFIPSFYKTAMCSFLLKIEKKTFQHPLVLFNGFFFDNEKKSHLQ